MMIGMMELKTLLLTQCCSSLGCMNHCICYHKPIYRLELRKMQWDNSIKQKMVEVFQSHESYRRHRFGIILKSEYINLKPWSLNLASQALWCQR